MNQTYFGWHCPACGQGALVAADPTGTEPTLSPPCAHQPLWIRPESGGRLRLTVPCVACSTPHTFTLSDPAVLKQDFFCLPCPVSGLDCLFVGTKKRVQEAMEATRQEIARLIGLEERVAPGTVEQELGLEQPPEAPTPFYNPEIAAQMLFLIKDMALDDQVRCACGNRQLDMTLDPEHITLTCPQCRRQKRLACRATSDLARLEDMAVLEL